MKNNYSDIKKAKKYLDKNKCVAVPTETVYGLAANAYSDEAVKKIFHLKKRPKNHPFIVHYSHFSKLKDDCHVNDNFLNLQKNFVIYLFVCTLYSLKSIFKFKYCNI